MDTTDTVYAANANYGDRGERNTRHTDDGILADENEGVAVFLAITDNGDGSYSGQLTIGISYSN